LHSQICPSKLSIHVPGTDVDVERDNIPIPPNHEVHVKLHPEITIAAQNIRDVPEVIHIFMIEFMSLS
jgi:hypothetical protein